MKLNPDCVRDVLLYLEENLQITNNHRFSTISLSNLQEALSTKYRSEDVFYSVYNLRQIRFIEGRISDVHDMKMFFCEIQNITYAGHQFLNTVRPETVWFQTKGIVSKIGNHALGFIESVAHDIAVESAKQAVVITMTQQHQ